MYFNEVLSGLGSSILASQYGRKISVYKSTYPLAILFLSFLLYAIFCIISNTTLSLVTTSPPLLSLLSLVSVPIPSSQS
jgi:hypothetical protein